MSFASWLASRKQPRRRPIRMAVDIPGLRRRPPYLLALEELELGVRSYNCLKRAGIQTVGDLVSKTESELNAIPNFGKKSIDEVIETLHARGLDLRQD